MPLVGLPDPSLSASAEPYPAGTHLAPNRPHPAVARIVVPESGATSYGSGTLVDVRDQFGLVVTNWHVVRDGQGDVEVIFPDGFRSKARPLKVDADWDLAALVIWRPQVPPVSIAPHAPQPGDQLTICGYGSGVFRAATGRCTQYYAPRADFPQHMVELDVEARQGDSGGPIFNERGELAGVLFGAGRGTTLGSFGGRVGSFLATLAPDIGRAADNALVERDASDAPGGNTGALQLATEPESEPNRRASGSARDARTPFDDTAQVRGIGAEKHAALWTEASGDAAGRNDWQSAKPPAEAQLAVAAVEWTAPAWLGLLKNVLAAVGVAAILAQVLRVAG